MSATGVQRSELFANALAGSLSGVTVDAALYPLDTLKTRLQAKRHGTATPRMGAAAFYRGMLSHMLGSAPAACTFWVVYESAKKATAAATGGEYLPLTHVASAVIADIAVVSVRNPFEIVKQQMQVGLHKSMSGAVRHIVRAEGLRGMYAGWGSTVMREAPFDAIQFLLYEELKRRWVEAQGGTPLVLWQNGAAGFIAGGCSAGLTTPLDVVKTRLMTQTGVAEAERYRGVYSTLRRIYAEEGAAALFSGVVPRVAWISMGGAIFIGSFEEIRRQVRGVTGGGA